MKFTTVTVDLAIFVFQLAWFYYAAVRNGQPYARTATRMGKKKRTVYAMLA